MTVCRLRIPYCFGAQRPKGNEETGIVIARDGAEEASLH